MPTCCKQAKRGKKSKTAGSLPAAASTSSSSSSRPCFGKDTGLALFHALGKILYNKRPEADGGGAPESMTGAAIEGRLLPQFSEAMQMPSSSKQSEVADRWGMLALASICALAQVFCFFLWVV